ncbi:MAG: aminoacyl-tRNA hydrolase [Planctomycetaceae bacterium]|jgi:ribosome-associated protein|nr:aminoacyl-tRNA hydrolase [Planctomycetaceae bacterium]
MFIVTPTLQIPLSEIQFTYVRSGGPGGQNVNKVSSKAVLRWNPAGWLDQSVVARLFAAHPNCRTRQGEILLTSQRTRDALKNHDDCLDKLRTMIIEASKVQKRRIPTKPTRSSIKRRLEEKSKKSHKKEQRRKIFDE